MKNLITILLTAAALTATAFCFPACSSELATAPGGSAPETEQEISGEGEAPAEEETSDNAGDGGEIIDSENEHDASGPGTDGSQEHIHNYTYIDYLAPTCDDSGNIACLYCADCEKYFYEDGSPLEPEDIAIQPDGHDYVEHIISATCKEEGRTVYICSVCNDRYTDENSYTAKVPHVIVTWITSVEAGCENIGEEYGECSECGAVVFRDIAKKGHNYIKNVVAPTCTEQGYTEYICSLCGDRYTDEESYTAPVPHDMGEWKEALKPDCENGGKLYRECADCGAGEYKDIPPAGHKYYENIVDATCTEGGYTEYICSVCGDRYTDENSRTEAKSHDYAATVVPPNVNEEGYTLYECLNCDDYYAAHYTDRLCSDGLIFVLSEDGKSYTVAGISEGAVIEELYIPSVYLGLPVTAIADSAFANNRDMTAAVLGEGIITIGASAFENCISLESVNIPLSTSVIGRSAFSKCSCLTEILYQAKCAEDCAAGVFYNAGADGRGIVLTVGAQVEKIPANLFLVANSFSAVPKITCIQFEEGSVLTEIGDSAFAWCACLEYIEFPAALEKIGAEAFYGCSSLQCAVIGAKTEVGDYAFYGTASGFELRYV